MIKAGFNKKICRILTLFVIFGLTLPGFSMYVGNATPRAFKVPVDGATSKTSSISSYSIDDLVIKSATYFLKGKSEVDLLSAKLEAAELEGVHFYELQQTVNNALENMRAARYYYGELKKRADVTPYNQDVINQLAYFDYNSFKIEYSMNGDIFDLVKDYLKAGDVRGVYGRFSSYTDNIINILETVQTDVYYWNFPEKSIIWKLNQECAQMHLFGQYLAQVFYNL